MDLSDDHSPPRRPLFFPVVIATVFLSIIGMSVGLVLGARQKADLRAQQNQQSQQRATPLAPSPEPTPTAKPCRDETQAVAPRFGATGTLRIALVLRTESSVVWICEDDASRYYYHGNRGGEKAKWVEGETALFMADVQRDGRQADAACL